MTTATPTPSPLLNLDDAAAMLSVSKGTLNNLIRRGELESIKIGRRRLVPRTVLEAFIRDRTQ